MARMENDILYIKVEDFDELGKLSVLDWADNGDRCKRWMEKHGAKEDTQCHEDPREQ